jgi:cellulose synthase/poly-beta-1,6-N-acetylglucosamine synthase-like glycosyltransferase
MASALNVLDVLVALLSVIALAPAAYLFLLTLLSRRRPAPVYGEPRLKFDLVVPAHDEEVGIADTVASLLAVDWPEELRRVVVVADNCKDGTAARAAEAGATVLVRTDAERRGKGYALHYAFERSLADGFADAIVVVDADTDVSPNLLRAFAARLEAGEVALQAEYGVRNPNASWRTRLMVIAMAVFHVLRSLARERLRVSVGLRGNGMCFATRALREVPHEAFSIVEDVEYGIRLGEAGHRVAYAAEAVVRGEMVSGERASRSQRRRWEQGRAALAKRHGWRLVRRGLATRSGLLLDLGLDVLVPPLSRIVLLIVAGSTVAGGLAVFLAREGTLALSPAPWALAGVLIVVYVLRGVWLAGVGWRGLVDLLWAPVYVIWKTFLGLGARAEPREWVRTTREKRP